MENIRQQSHRILVVDDSEDIRILLEQLLRKAGYEVFLAEDGQVSLTQARLHHPDLILMDMSLPNIDGWEAVGHLRKIPGFGATPIIAVTAHISPSDKARALAAGCSSHVNKPFNTRSLLHTIKELLPEKGTGHES